MKIKKVIIIVAWSSFFLLISCDPDNSLFGSGKNALLGTVWVKDRVEIYTPDSMLIEEITATICEKNELLKFDKKDRLIRLNDCKVGEIEYECGEWRVNGDELQITIGLNRLAPGLCDLGNYGEHIIANDIDYTLSNDQLIISEKGIDSYRNYLSADTLNKISSGELLISTFYIKSSDDLIIPSEVDCCDP